MRQSREAWGRCQNLCRDDTIRVMDNFEPAAYYPGIDPELLRAQILDDLGKALELPLGAERLRWLKELADLAHRQDSGDTEATVLLEIVWDLLEAGDTPGAMETCAWVMTQIADGVWEPSQEHTQTLASQLLQLPILAARHPGIDLDIIEHLTFWMDFFAAKAQIPLANRWRTRHQVELGLGHRTAALEALDLITELEDLPKVPNGGATPDANAWVAQIQSESDCPIHHYRSRIAWAVNSREYARALELYRDGQERTTQAGWHCQQPDDINGLLMLPLAWAGEGDAAWRAHERSYRHQSEASQYLGDIASHLRFCAGTWSIAEGLELLGNHAHWFENPEDPWDLLVATRAAALFLERATQSYAQTGYGQVELGFAISGDNPWFNFPTLAAGSTLEEATSRLRHTALELALLYDRRNANNTVSNRTRAVLHEAPLCHLEEVAPLLRCRNALADLLASHGILENQAHWALPNLQEWFATSRPQPIPEFHQLEFTVARQSQATFEAALAEVELEVLPPAISTTKESLVIGADRVALLAACGQWTEVIDQAEALLELGQRLDEHRQSLRLATYLVQAYWQCDNLAPARNWLIRADELADATVAATPRKILEDLAQLAG